MTPPGVEQTWRLEPVEEMVPVIETMTPPGVEQPNNTTKGTATNW